MGLRAETEPVALTTTMLRTRLCSLLGIEIPIVAAPMGPDLSGPELVAAVSNAGGVGILQAQMSPPAVFQTELRRVRELTAKPFAVNFILEFPVEELFAVCLQEKVPAVSFFWGDPSPYVERAHRAGMKVIHQVGSVKEATRAAETGVDIVVAQGMEAGGHIRGEVGTLSLVPRVVDAVEPVLVVAAGGIADGRGVAAALALGADGAMLGTRFLATDESRAHPLYKRKVVEAGEDDTVRTILFGHGWPYAAHRTLKTSFVQQWIGKEERAQQSRTDEPIVGETIIGGRRIPLRRFMGFPPNLHTTGDIESMDLLMGQSAGMIDAIRPAGKLVTEIAEEAQRVLKRMGRLAEA